MVGVFGRQLFCSTCRAALLCGFGEYYNQAPAEFAWSGLFKVGSKERGTEWAMPRDVALCIWKPLSSIRSGSQAVLHF
jgi:hypothetical protein